MSKEKKTISKSETAVTKPLTSEQLRSFLVNSMRSDCDPSALLEKLDNAVTKLRNSDSKTDKEMEEINQVARDALPLVALDTHYILARGVMEEIRPFVIDFANQLNVEYDCKTPSEKALVETVTAAYARILQFTGVMTRQVRDKHCSDILNSFYKVASQELDRANRHFITALATLKQLKSPAMTVQVKATNAFVAQNQQVNATALDPSEGNKKKIYENIESK